MDSKIKIAVSLSGMPRHFEECYENTLEFFDVEDCEVDFFIHSWVNSWYPPRAKSPKISPETSEKLNEKDLYKKLTQSYNPKKIIIEDQLTNKDLKKSIESIRTNLLRKTSRSIIPSWLVDLLKQNKNSRFLSHPLHLAQTYSISKSAEIISTYSKENNIDYDLVFRFRFDNFMELKTKEYRTKVFKDMAYLITRDHYRSQNSSRFKREYLFTAWTTIFGDCGYADPSTWIGDKIFACSGRVFNKFENYFRAQLLKILSYDPSLKNVGAESPHFMPERLLATFCMENDFWSFSRGSLSTFSLVSYREYHKKFEDQSFRSLQYQYNIREKMNHDSTEGVVIDHDY